MSERRTPAGETCVLAPDVLEEMCRRLREQSSSNGFETYSAVANTCEIAGSAVYNLFNGNKPTGGSVAVLRKICDRLKISADYILSLSDTPSLNPSARAAQEYTHLSTDSVVKLNTTIQDGDVIQHHYLLDSLICSGTINDIEYDAISAASALRSSKESEQEDNTFYHSIDSEAKRHGLRVLNSRDACQYYLENAVSIFREFLKAHIETLSSNEELWTRIEETVKEVLS